MLFLKGTYSTIDLDEIWCFTVVAYSIIGWDEIWCFTVVAYSTIGWDEILCFTVVASFLWLNKKHDSPNGDRSQGDGSDDQPGSLWYGRKLKS